MKEINILSTKTLNSHTRNVFVVYIGFVAILIINYIVSPASANFRDFINLLRQSSGLGILSIGQTMVILTGGIDLSLGSLVTFVHVLIMGMMGGNEAMILPLCLMGLAIGALAGFINGVGIAKAKIAPFIMTLCTDFILRGLYMIYTKGQPRGILADSFRELGRMRIWGFLPISVIVWISLSILFIFILKRTTFGAKVHMIGANPMCSYLSGVKNSRVIITVYTLAGMLAALTAILLTMDMSATSLNLGADYSMDSISAVVVGGTFFSGGIGGVEGTIAGVLIIRLITALLQRADIANWGKLVIQSILILTVVAISARRRKI